MGHSEMEGEDGEEEDSRTIFQENVDRLIELLPRLGNASLQIVAKEMTEDLVRRLFDSQFCEIEDFVRVLEAAQNEGQRRQVQQQAMFRQPAPLSGSFHLPKK